MDTTLAGPAMPSWRTTSDIAKSHDDLAATNGDFSVPGVRPVHLFAQDGDILHSAAQGPMFALRRDETGAYVGTPDLEIAVTDLDSGQTFDLDRWNRGSPTPGEIAGFSPIGGTLNVYDAIGGMPILVQDGRVVAENCSSAFCRRNPRTAIGWTASGGVLLVVIDGRQPRWSVGSSLGELARLMIDLGAVHAMNLDGGGSSAMWVDGELVNRPSDGQQRNVTTSVLVLPGPDPGESQG